MIRKLRTNQGVSQEFIANRIGMSVSAYRRVEKDERKILTMAFETCVNLAKCLRISLYALLKIAKGE